MGLILLAGLLYFAPFLTANHMYHKNQLAIFFLNLFLGWTVIGWVVALVWAVKK